MKVLRIALVLVAATIGYPALASAATTDDCPYRPNYVALRSRVATTPPAAGVTALYRYAADPENDNPAACEGIAIEQAIAGLELQLVRLVSGRRSLKPAASYRCTAFDARSTACNGLVGDDTALPDPQGGPVERASTPLRARVVSDLPDAKLIALYSAPVGKLQDGVVATRLPPGPTLRLGKPASTIAVIAIFSAPQPWRYRKLVWYLR